MMERYYLLGSNVSRSASPAMMNSAFEATGIEASYAAKSIDPSGFREGFLSLRKESSGMNITIPFKSEVIPLLDGLDLTSKKIGAVNVTKRSGERYLGFNTDVEGIAVPLRQTLGRAAIRSALLVGAGGAARAFCEAMSQMSCRSMTVATRDATRGSLFVEEVSATYPEIDFAWRSIDGLGDGRDGHSDLVFNATPMGSGAIGLAEGVRRAVSGAGVVFDAVYRPIETELLKFAKEKGCRVIHGHEMLLNQGTAAFEKWTGVRAPVEVMRRALLNELGAAA